MGDSAETLAEVMISNIHCSTLIHQASHLITETYCRFISIIFLAAILQDPELHHSLCSQDCPQSPHPQPVHSVFKYQLQQSISHHQSLPLTSVRKLTYTQKPPSSLMFCCVVPFKRYQGGSGPSLQPEPTNIRLLVVWTRPHPILPPNQAVLVKPDFTYENIYILICTYIQKE